MTQRAVGLLFDVTAPPGGRCRPPLQAPSWSPGAASSITAVPDAPIRRAKGSSATRSPAMSRSPSDEAAAWAHGHHAFGGVRADPGEGQQHVDGSRGGHRGGP